ncbi:MAG: hypothetical protein FD149_997 [Rhodospirillaceae bacterium]|nr:MAG: hypothetical protein FD149_997 [Rhodospirillaceae bacterium]
MNSLEKDQERPQTTMDTMKANEHAAQKMDVLSTGERDLKNARRFAEALNRNLPEFVRTGQSQMTIARRIERFVAQGLLAKGISPQDRRMVTIMPTQKFTDLVQGYLRQAMREADVQAIDLLESTPILPSTERILAARRSLACNNGTSV